VLLNKSIFFLATVGKHYFLFRPLKTKRNRERTRLSQRKRNRQSRGGEYERHQVTAETYHFVGVCALCRYGYRSLHNGDGFHLFGKLLFEMDT
jgi:hypothetical protein